MNNRDRKRREEDKKKVLLIMIPPISPIINRLILEIPVAGTVVVLEEVPVEAILEVVLSTRDSLHGLHQASITCPLIGEMAVTMGPLISQEEVFMGPM